MLHLCAPHTVESLLTSSYDLLNEFMEEVMIMSTVTFGISGSCGFQV